MNSTSRGLRFVRIAARSPGFSSTGPDVARTATPSSLPMTYASVVLPRPGRAVEQHVIERLAALARRGDRDLQVLAHALLADVVRRASAAAGPPRTARRRRHGDALHEPGIGHTSISSLRASRAAAVRTRADARRVQHLVHGLLDRRALVAEIRRAPTADRRARRRRRPARPASHPAGRPAAAGPCSSTTSRSAVFLPTPGILVSRARSPAESRARARPARCRRARPARPSARCR